MSASSTICVPCVRRAILFQEGHAAIKSLPSRTEAKVSVKMSKEGEELTMMGVSRKGGMVEMWHAKFKPSHVICFCLAQASALHSRVYPICALCPDTHRPELFLQSNKHSSRLSILS